jgi:hypothetical protein
MIYGPRPPSKYGRNDSSFNEAHVQMMLKFRPGFGMHSEDFSAILFSPRFDKLVLKFTVPHVLFSSPCRRVGVGQ